MVPCKIYPDFYRVPTEIFLGYLQPRFFQGGSLKKVGCHTYKSEKKSCELPKKIWVDAYTLKKSQVAPYKNLGRFCRVPFKSLLRVQIRRLKVKYFQFTFSSTLFKNVIFCVLNLKTPLTKLCYKQQQQPISRPVKTAGL